MDNAAVITFLILIVLVLVLVVTYSGMDKKRYAAIFYFRYIEEGLGEWLRSAGEMPAAGDEAAREEFARLLEEYTRKKTKDDRRIQIANELHRMIEDRRPEAGSVMELTAVYEGFKDKALQYNARVKRYNESLDKGLGFLVAGMLRMKELTLLDDLSFVP